MEWIGGNYTLVATDGNPDGVLTERSTDQLTEARGIQGDQFCLNKDCHNMTREDLTAMTEVETDNPPSGFATRTPGSTASRPAPTATRRTAPACSPARSATPTCRSPRAGSPPKRRNCFPTRPNAKQEQPYEQ